MKPPAPKPVECVCGQRGDRPPGIKLSEYEHLTAVFVDNGPTDLGSVPTPQRLTCRSCGRSWPIVRGSITVRQP